MYILSKFEIIVLMHHCNQHARIRSVVVKSMYLEMSLWIIWTQGGGGGAIVMKKNNDW